MPRAALVILVLAALVAAVIVVAARVDGRGASGATGTAEVSQEKAPVPELLPVAPIVLDQATTDATQSARMDAVDDRPRIAGHVRIDGEWPEGEAVRVTAEIFVGRVNATPPVRASVAVARDGAFEIRVPSDTRYALLDVVSDTLHLAEPVEALPGATDVDLVPERAATLHGVVRMPPGLKLKDDDLRTVELSCSSAKGSDVPTRQTAFLKPWTPHGEETGAYAFTRLPTGVELVLEAKPSWGPRWRSVVAPLAPGERRKVVIELDAGVTLAGRVIDEHGAPVEGARVQAVEPPRPDGAVVRDALGRDWTSGDGTFELRGLPRGVLRVQADHDDLAGAPELLVDVTQGDVRGVVLVVERGGCVSGTVEWPDGSPVASFTVSVDQGNLLRTGSHAQGRFERCGIGSAPFALVVHAREGTRDGRARVEGLEVGASGVRVVLETREVFALRGMVVDPDDEPVERFRVRATGTSRAQRERTTEARDGNFYLDGLSSGEWDVRVESEDHLPATRRVRVGPGTDPLRVVLARAGRVRGVVVDPAGRPVRAEVRVSGGGERTRDRWESPTDDEGRFDVGASSAPLVVYASAEGYAPSEPLELAFAAGESVDDVVLRLRAPCRIEGRVLDAEGRPASLVRVSVGWENGRRDTETAARGEFVLEDLPAGPAVAVAFPADGSVLREPITVGTGTNSIELRLTAADPVRVRGTVEQGGRPVACRLSFWSPSGFAQAECGPDGRFEITLRQPGAWSVAAWRELEFDGSLHGAELVIPDVDAHTLALDLDAMRLASPDELGY